MEAVSKTCMIHLAGESIAKRAHFKRKEYAITPKITSPLSMEVLLASSNYGVLLLAIFAKHGQVILYWQWNASVALMYSFTQTLWSRVCLLQHSCEYNTSAASRSTLTYHVSGISVHQGWHANNIILIRKHTGMERLPIILDIFQKRGGMDQ